MTESGGTGGALHGPKENPILFPYNYGETKKACNPEMQAFDISRILVGSASFELATPAV
jgi:hypothetical protein